MRGGEEVVVSGVGRLGGWVVGRLCGGVVGDGEVGIWGGGGWGGRDMGWTLTSW